MPQPPLRPLRIARVITRMGVGGAAWHVALLTRHVNGAAFQTRLFAGPTTHIEGDMLALRREREVRPILVPSLRRDADFSRDLRTLRDLTHHFRSFRPDLVDTHLSKAGFLGRWAAKMARVPAISHTFHINIFGGYGWNPLERQLYLRLERAAARWSDRLICLSDDLGNELLAQGIGEKSQFRTVALGLDLAPFEPTPAKIDAAREELRRELGLASDAILIGHISRLAPVKSVKTFVQAAAIMRQTRPDITFLVVGEGETRARLETLSTELGLKHHLRFLGLRADIARLNLALDAVALTSLQEGTPVSIIESLAAARPVVASDVGGVSRLIEHEKTGLLTAPNAPEAVASTLLRVLNEPEHARKWGAAGREKMRREFDLSRLVRDYRALYLELWREKTGC